MCLKKAVENTGRVENIEGTMEHERTSEKV